MKSRLDHSRFKASRWALGAVYTPLLAAALGIMMARLFVAAQVLEVNAFASYSVALLVSSSFCMLGCLGLQRMVERDMPILIIQQRSRRAMMILFQAIAVALICGAIGCSAAFWLIDGEPQRLLGREQLVVGIAHGLSQQVFLLATLESRSRGLPMLFAIQYFARAVAVIAIGVSAMVMSGSGTIGAVAEAVTTVIISAAVIGGSLRRASSSCGASMLLAVRHMPHVRWRTATTLLGTMVVMWISCNIDRWIAEQRLDIAGFATYAFAANALTIASAAQMTIGAALFPKLSRNYAVSGVIPTFRAAAAFSACLGAAGLLLAPPVWACWRLVVSEWYPQYAASVTIAPLLLTIAVLRVSDYWTGFLIVVGAEARLLATSSCLVLGITAGWWWLIGSGPAVSVTEIAWLALCLAASTYVAAAAAAWGVARKSRHA